MWGVFEEMWIEDGGEEGVNRNDGVNAVSCAGTIGCILVKWEYFRWLQCSYICCEQQIGDL